MFIRTVQIISLMGSVCFFTQSAMASDIAREQRLAEQIVDTIFDGEPLYLNADQHRFLGIYTESADTPVKRAVLLLHGRGYHPDWEQVIRPLRIGLTEHNWNTLSLQLPVLEKQAKYYDYVPIFGEALPRIQAGIDHLVAQGNTEIIMISHSCGVHMAMAWVRKFGTSTIDGFIGIGMGATDYKQPMREPFPFEKITVPIFDLYGGLDYPAVQNGAASRLKALQKNGDPRSRQQMLMDSDHYVHDQDDDLLKAVVDWLSATYPLP